MYISVIYFYIERMEIVGDYQLLWICIQKPKDFSFNKLQMGPDKWQVG